MYEGWALTNSTDLNTVMPTASWSSKMKDEDRWWKGLLAVGGALFSEYIHAEARKALEQHWRENNQLGIFLSAGVMTAARTRTVLSLKELFRALGLSTGGPYLSDRKRRRNPLFLPNYEAYPT